MAKKSSVTISPRSSRSGSPSAAAGTQIAREAGVQSNILTNGDQPALVPLKKAPTGIVGLDEITNGGLPHGRPTIVCGSAGCGKTMLGIEFLVRGALQYNEPGVMIAFEETPADLAANVASLGFDLNDLVARKLLYMDYIHVDPHEIQETGEYDLEGLFVRLQLAIDTVGAKRVVLDTLEALFSGFLNMGILRAEFRRLFRWLKDRNLTTVITAERGEGTLTRHGLEEYVSDCVILLDHRTYDSTSTRRLRVIKYRGSSHGTNEYPFLIDERGISVLPLSSLQLDYPVSNERISTGVPDLDEMLEGKGLYRGSTVLVSGVAGSGKTSLSVHQAVETCRRGERCLYLALEESVAQLVRNARSIGIDMEPFIRDGSLRIEASRPTQYSFEMHLVRIHNLVNEFEPNIVIMDPITNLISSGGTEKEIRSILLRLVDFLKTRQITAYFTSLTAAGTPSDQTEVGISSLIDSWFLVRDIEVNGERNRGLYVIKSRGMAHSNQVREFLLTNDGIKLVPAYLGFEGVLTGSARVAQEARERSEASARSWQSEQKRIEFEAKRLAMEAQITSLRAAYEAEKTQWERSIERDATAEDRLTQDRSAMAQSRHVKESHDKDEEDDR